MGIGRVAAVAPGAHAARIHVNKAGAGIVTHAASAKRESCVTQSLGVDARDTDINGVRLHVQAIFRHTCGAGAEKFVTPGSAIATNNIDFPIGVADGSRQIRQNVEDPRIIVFYFACAMVPQEMVQLLLCLQEVVVAAAIDDINAFACVRMIQA